MRSGGAGGVRAVLALAALVAGSASMTGCPDRPKVTFDTPRREYVFRTTGDSALLPWNRTLYLHDADREKAPLALVFVEGEDGVPVLGVPGTEWRVLSEIGPSRAMAKLLRITARKGTYGDSGAIEVHLPPRTTVTVRDLPDDRSAELTFADDDGNRLVAVRDVEHGVRWALWTRDTDKPDWRGHGDAATARPWSWTEMKPGDYVVGARSGEGSWIVKRVTLGTAEAVVMDCAAAPRGGAVVQCEDGGAEILVGGELPLPSLRVTDLTFRSRWTGVPAGRHAMVWTDGRKTPFECPAAGTVNVARPEKD